MLCFDHELGKLEKRHHDEVFLANDCHVDGGQLFA